MKQIKEKLDANRKAALKAYAQDFSALTKLPHVVVYDANLRCAVPNEGDLPEEFDAVSTMWRKGDDSQIHNIVSASGDLLGFVSPRVPEGVDGIRFKRLLGGLARFLEQASLTSILANAIDAIPDPIVVLDEENKPVMRNHASRNSSNEITSYQRVRPMKDGFSVSIENSEIEVSERENALARAHMVIAKAEKLAKLGYFVFDTDNLKMTHLSPGIYSIATSLDPSEDGLTYEQLIERVHPDDRERVVAETWASIHEGAELSIEFRTLTADGDIQHLWLTEATLPADSDGTIKRVGIVQDITDREEREADLKENIAFRQAATETALDCVVTIDKDGVIKEFNPAAEETFGFVASDVIGKPLSETIIPEELRTAHLKGFEHYLKTGEHNVLRKRIEVPAVKADGTRITVELAITPFEVDERQFFTAYLRDITEAKQQQEALLASEEELRTAKEQAEAASEAKSQFLATMSHEIRTPLNGVIGGLGLLADTTLDPQQYAHTELARNAAEGLLTLVNDLLDFEKIEAGHVELEIDDFDLWECVHRVADVIKPIAQQKKLPVLITIDSDVPRFVRSDASRLRQVLLNLVSNAVKFTETGSVQVRVLADPEQSQLRFEVEDTGIGIPAGMEDRLFGDFVQLESDYRRRFGGTGLGLAISKRLCTLMGGKIGFTSREGTGSTFWFLLPIEVGDSVTPTNRPNPKSEPDILKGRILLAEDSQTNAYVALALLRQKGARVDHVSNGAEAISAMQARAYDLVLMDVSMPVVDGLEATRKIRQLPGAADVPIVAMTAHVAEEDRKRCFEAGMCDYITKPIDKSSLYGTVARWIGRKSEAEAESAQRVGVEVEASMLDTRQFVENWRDLDQETRADIINIFRKECEARVEALQSGDLERSAATREAHSLKSASANVGATALSKVAADLEQAYRLGEDSQSILRRLKDVAVATLEEVDRVQADEEFWQQGESC